MIVGGIRFVLDKIASAVDTEWSDESHLREELLAAQMRLELGEIDEKEFQALERDMLARLREIRVRQRGEKHGEPLEHRSIEIVTVESAVDSHASELEGQLAP